MSLANTWVMSKPKPPATFWERLVQASEYADVSCTPKDVAKELGIWASAVTKYLDGGFPAKKKIAQLAIRRGVNAEYLLSGQGPMVSEKALDETTQELLKLWREIDDQAKERLLANLRYERTAAESLMTGKRQQLTSAIIRQLEGKKQ